VQAWTGSCSLTLSSNDIIQLPTRKLRDRVSLSEPLAFRFAATVQPCGRFVARRGHCALAHSKSGGRRDGGVPAVGVLRCSTGGVGGLRLWRHIYRSSRVSHTERRQAKGKGRVTEMKPRVGGLPRVEKRVLDPK